MSTAERLLRDDLRAFAGYRSARSDALRGEVHGDLAPGLTHDDVAAMATRIGERLATDGEFRARVDAVSFTIEATPVSD